MKRCNLSGTECGSHLVDLRYGGRAPLDWFVTKLCPTERRFRPTQLDLCQLQNLGTARLQRFTRRPTTKQGNRGNTPFIWIRESFSPVPERRATSKARACVLRQMDNVAIVRLGRTVRGTTGDTTECLSCLRWSAGCTLLVRVVEVSRRDARFQNIGIIPDVEVYPTHRGRQGGQGRVYWRKRVGSTARSDQRSETTIPAHVTAEW